MTKSPLQSRAAMWGLLTVVAAAAAVLSFASLRDLARLCGFAAGLAWLLPITIDAGAAAGCLAWLRPGVSDRTPERRFARALTVTLLTSSVAGNAMVHSLAAYHLAPPWWLLVAVSGIAPAVLGAVVHLSVLVAQRHPDGPDFAVDDLPVNVEGEGILDWWGSAPYADTPGGRAAALIDAGAGRRKLAKKLGISEHQARLIIASRNGDAQ